MTTTDEPDPDVDAPVDVDKVLRELAEHLDHDLTVNIGFSSTLDIDYTPILPFFNRPMNNVGDPWVESAYPRNTKHLEVQVLRRFAGLLRAGPKWWGVTTNGGTEGILYGFLHARHRYPDALVLHSTAVHYSVAKDAALVGLPTLAVRANSKGELDLADLRDVIRANRHRPLIVLASIGTTMTEAVDPADQIRAALHDYAVTRAWIHADAALSGLPLALLPPGSRPAFDLADGADSISISAHKFLGSPFPCGVFLSNHGPVPADRVDYINTIDSTVAGSRSGHAPLLMWYAINKFGVEGLRRRAQECWRVADYAVHRLQAIDWPAWRHPHAMTVVIDTPPVEVRKRFSLATTDNGHSHLIAMPHVTTAAIDALAEHITALRPRRQSTTGQWPIVPAPRTAEETDRADAHR